MHEIERLMEVVRSLYQGQLTVTLRYFFSAAFQGVAALVGLWAIFGLYVMETLDRRKQEVDRLVERNTNFPSVQTTIAKSGWQGIARDFAQTGGQQNDLFRFAVKRYNLIAKRRGDLTAKFKLILSLGVATMILSLAGLLVCGARQDLDRWLTAVAVVDLVSTIVLLRLIARNSLKVLSESKSENDLPAEE